MPDDRTTAYYETHADALAKRYAVGGPDLNGVFEPGTRVLDIGCGSGRDLLRLLNLGVDAHGCDLSPAMLDQAARTLRDAGHSPDDRLRSAALPDLTSYPEAQFDGLLCAAVLMHLPKEQHFDALLRMHRLLKPGGQLQLSFPLSRPDTDPDTHRDPHGRLFLPLDPDALTLLCERIGFQRLSREDSPDSLGRESITWCTLRFKRLDQGMQPPLQQVEQILNRDKKSATYKLALFRALAELAQTRPNLGRFTGDGHVLVPVAAVAEKWILYYWPLLDSPQYLPQQNGEKPGCAKPTAVRTALTPLVEAFGDSGGFQAFAAAIETGRMPPSARPLLTEAEKRIRHTIWNMPVRYAGGGEDFSVLQYHRSSKSIRMRADLWRELCLTGSWIADATILRWAELTHRLSGNTIPVSQVVDCLLTVPDPERRVREARAFYESRQPDLSCVWTDQPIRSRFEVDHAIPFTLWRSNALWNLFPATRTANNQKRDKLPTQHLLRYRRDRIIACWEELRGHFGDPFEREAARLMEQDRFPDTNWEASLFSRFAEAVESTAHLRGSARWEPEGLTPERNPAATLHTTAPYPRSEERLIVVRESTEQGTRDIPPRSTPENRQPTPATNTPDNSSEPEPPEPIPFQNCLPLVGSLAAGDPFQGFQAGSLDEHDSFDWLPVPEHLCRENRFLVEVAGDSMEPTLPQGSLAVFEYHRRAPEGRKIVIAHLPEFGITGDASGTATIKFLRQTPTHWVFEPDNPAYDPIEVSKIDCPQHPILGEFVVIL